MDKWASYQQPQQIPLRPPPPPPPTTPPPRPPSSESTIQRSLAGSLTLHEYRKLQSTPSPPTRDSAKTLKRKAALDNLARRRAKRASPDAHSPTRIPGALQLQSKAYRETADSRPPNTGEAEEFYLSYLHSQQSGNSYNSSTHRPPPTPASASESEISAYLSSLQFPQPPSSSPPQQRALTHPRHTSPYSLQQRPDPTTPATVVHYRGASFDILNPDQSLSQSQAQPLVHHHKRRTKYLRGSAASSRSDTNDMTSSSSGAGSTKSGRQYLPHRALFQDLPTAHSSITARSMKDRSTPSPTPLDLKQRMADLPLPPQPVLAAQQHSQNYEASLPAEFVVNMPPQLPEEKPVQPPSWKEKLGNAFARKAPVVSQQLPTVNETSASNIPHPRSVVRPRSSTYLPPFKRAGNITQSVPYLTTGARQQDHHRTSSSAGQLSHHYYDDSSIYHNGSGGASSLAASSIRGEGSAPYGLDYSEEVGAQSHGYGFYDKNIERETDLHEEYSGEAYSQNRHDSEAIASSVGAPSRSTVGSIVKQYGDVEAGGVADFEDIELDSDGESNADVREKEAIANKGKFYANPGMQLFQLGRSILGTGIGVSDSRKDPPSGSGKENHRFTAPTPPTQPPTTPLPPGPLANYPLRMSSNNRNTFSQGLSHDVSYGDTRNLLEISQNLSRGGLANQSTGALTSASAQASSCALGYFGDNDLNAADTHASEPHLAPSRPGAKRNLTSPVIGRLQTESNSPRLSVPHSHSSSDKGLESDVYHELRRQSGLSNLSGNVFILSDDEIRMTQFSPDARARASAEDLGPGGSQTSSSRGSMSRDPSNASSGRGGSEFLRDGARRGVQVLGLQVERDDANVTDKGSFASSFQATNYSDASSQRDLLGGPEDENDGDWETVAESGAFSRFGTGRGDDMGRVLPGSSVGDFSSHGSLNMERIKTNPFKATSRVIKHPADPRYEHVYRLRTVTPEGPAILLPTYNFSGGAGFPNRNAMTPPLLTSTPNKYQHPTPLSPDHTHPFNSSPPGLPSRGTRSRAHDRPSSPRNSFHGSDGGSQTDHEAHRKHRHNTYGSSVRQSSSVGSEISKGLPQEVKKKVDDSLGEVGMDGSYATNAWMDNFGEPGPAINSDELPGPNGSFAKVTVLGPRANITGTPDGTGMREVGSSLAGESSHAHWSSSPYPQGSSSPLRPMPMPNPSSPTPLEPTYSPRLLREQPARHQQGHYNKQIRQYLEERKAMGLAEPTFYPAMPLQSTHTRAGTDVRLSPIDSISMSSFRGTYPDRPVSYNATPPLPHLWTAKQRQAIIDGRRKENYQQHPRKLSSASTESYKRQGTISRAILITCILFPVIGWMMLLLLGYGCMDSTVAYCTNGEILKLRKTEKSIAIAFSWAVIVVLIVGLIIASVVVAMEYH